MDWSPWIAPIVGLVANILSLVGGYFLLLRYLIRRQIDGNWVLRVDHDKQLADKDTQIAAEREVTKEWKDAWTAETAAGRIKDDTINKAVAANKISDHFYETVMPKAPRVGDNVGEGVPRS